MCMCACVFLHACVHVYTYMYVNLQYKFVILMYVMYKVCVHIASKQEDSAVQAPTISLILAPHG